MEVIKKLRKVEVVKLEVMKKYMVVGVRRMLIKEQNMKMEVMNLVIMDVMWIYQKEDIEWK